MLARLQTFVTFVLLCSALTWASCLLAFGRPVWAWAGALLILLGYALFLGSEFAILYFVQSAEAAPRPGAAQLLRAWWGEIVSAPRVFFWRQPFRSNAEPDSVPSAASRRPGIVLVHGFVCNRGFWNPWMRELRARQIPFAAVNLEPVFGSIDHYPRLIEAAVSRLETCTVAPVVIVGHSMGGLAIRAWLAEFSADARVSRVITIGSPHQGTWLARYGYTTNAKQMRLNSQWLTALAAGEPSHRRARFTCFFGHCDNIVFPAASGTLPGADNRHISSTAHVHMAFQRVVFSEVLRWVELAAAPPAVSREPAVAQ